MESCERSSDLSAVMHERERRVKVRGEPYRHFFPPLRGLRRTGQRRWKTAIKWKCRSVYSRCNAKINTVNYHSERPSTVNHYVNCCTKIITTTVLCGQNVNITSSQTTVGQLWQHYQSRCHSHLVAIPIQGSHIFLGGGFENFSTTFFRSIPVMLYTRTHTPV